jgi:hypothetical protein
MKAVGCKFPIPYTANFYFFRKKDNKGFSSKKT